MLAPDIRFGRSPAARLSRRAAGVLGILVAAILLGIMLLTCVDVVGRYFLSKPVPGAFEITELAMGALIFTSLPLVTLHRQQVTVDLFDFVVPERWKRAQSFVLYLISALCLAVVSWRLWVKAGQMHQYGDTTASLQITVYPLVYYMAVQAALTAVLLVVMAFLDSGHVKKEESP